MRAVILRKYGSTDNFEMEDIPIPPFQKGQIRIKIKAVSFNPVNYLVKEGLPENKFVTSNIPGIKENYNLLNPDSLIISGTQGKDSIQWVFKREKKL